jgi:hypothetical protein
VIAIALFISRGRKQDADVAHGRCRPSLALSLLGGRRVMGVHPRSGNAVRVSSCRRLRRFDSCSWGASAKWRQCRPAAVPHAGHCIWSMGLGVALLPVPRFGEHM